MTDIKTPSPSDAEIDEFLDSTGNIDWVLADKRERFRLFARAVLAKWGQPQAVAGGEPVGSLSIQHFRGSRSMENVDFDYFGKLDPGTYQVYTAPPPQAVREPRVSEDQWRVLCEQTWDLLEAHDRGAAGQLLLDGFKARGITKGGQHGAD